MTNQDFAQHLTEQLGFLEASAASFDAGAEAEAKRLALAIRMLVHDTNHSASLLTHLQVRDKLPWTDSAPGSIVGAAVTLSAGLCTMQMQLGGRGEARYAAPLSSLAPERIHPGQAFIDWWSVPVLVDAESRSFTRQNLVLWVANKDGGAHVDGALPGAYQALSRENSIGFTAGPGNEEGSVALAFGLTASDGELTRSQADGEPLANSLVLCQVRQIAWEVRDTLTRHLVLDSPIPFVRAPICPLSIHQAHTPDPGGNCPCGSGRPYERCFGLRRPRRTFTVDDLIAEARRTGGD